MASQMPSDGNPRGSRKRDTSYFGKPNFYKRTRSSNGIGTTRQTACEEYVTNKAAETKEESSKTKTRCRVM